MHQKNCTQSTGAVGSSTYLNVGIKWIATFLRNRSTNLILANQQYPLLTQTRTVSKFVQPTLEICLADWAKITFFSSNIELTFQHKSCKKTERSRGVVLQDNGSPETASSF